MVKTAWDHKKVIKRLKKNGRKDKPLLIYRDTDNPWPDWDFKSSIQFKSKFQNKKRSRTTQFEYKNIKPDIAEADTSGHCYR